jgi:hypothetical protein
MAASTDGAVRVDDKESKIETVGAVALPLGFPGEEYLTGCEAGTGEGWVVDDLKVVGICEWGKGAGDSSGRWGRSLGSQASGQEEESGGKSDPGETHGVRQGGRK